MPDFWRTEIDESRYILIGENQFFSDGSGLQSFPVPIEQRIEVKKKDVIGWRVEGGPENLLGIIDYDIVEHAKKTSLTMTTEIPNIGNHIHFPYLSNRIYSIACKFETLSQYFLEDYGHISK